MTQGTLYLTAREMDAFVNDDDVGVYIPREMNVEETREIRPTVTTKNLVQTHYVLTHYEDDDLEHGIATFDYWDEWDERTARLKVEIVETHDAIPVTACIDVLRRNHKLDDAAIAALLEEHARELREEQW